MDRYASCRRQVNANQRHTAVSFLSGAAWMYQPELFSGTALLLQDPSVPLPMRDSLSADATLLTEETVLEGSEEMVYPPTPETSRQSFAQAFTPFNNNLVAPGSASRQANLTAQFAPTGRVRSNSTHSSIEPSSPLPHRKGMLATAFSSSTADRLSSVNLDPCSMCHLSDDHVLPSSAVESYKCTQCYKQGAYVPDFLFATSMFKASLFLRNYENIV
jgi:hypothetical protein